MMWARWELDMQLRFEKEFGGDRWRWMRIKDEKNKRK